VTAAQDHAEYRYLVRFSDGGASIRRFSRPLADGDQVERDGRAYTVVRAHRHPTSLGRAWAEPQRQLRRRAGTSA
jgi:hypothetical protein